MTKKEYWEAHVKKNPAFADEKKEIRITVGSLRKLMEEGYDKGLEHATKSSTLLSDTIKDVFKGPGLR